jgi:hypothetical protein
LDSIIGDHSANVILVLLDRVLSIIFITIFIFGGSSKIDQSEIPINTKTHDVDVPLERDVAKRTRLGENITIADGAVDPACIMKSENEGSNFVPVERR